MAPTDYSAHKPLLATDDEEMSVDTVTPSEDLEEITNSKVDRRTPLPKLQLFVLLYMQLAEPMTTHVMGPFIVQLIMETGITNGDVTKVGYYTGMVDSLFYLAEATTILQWGRLSDHIGRRPVLLIGLFGLSLSMFLLGLAQTFWLVVIARAMGGFLNGNIGVTKSMMGEMTDDTNVAQAFAMLPITFSIGNTLAPLIGGSLQHPYERFGGVFEAEFWRENPYFLPCVTASAFSISAFLVGFWLLQETAPCKTWRLVSKDQKNVPYIRLQGTDTQSSATLDVPTPMTERSLIFPTPTSMRPPRLRSLLTPRVLVVILNYSILGSVEVAFGTLQPLVLSTPIEHGGLGMKPSVIGVCMAGFGITKGTISALFFAPLIRRFGTKTVATTCAAAYLGCYGLFPVMNALARIEGRLTPLVWSVLILQLTMATLPPMGFSAIFIYLTHAAPTRSALGSTNGLAQTITSIMRSFGPATATGLFALSLKYNLLGGNLVYIMFCFFTIIAIMATRLFPAKPWERTND
ncbi:MFS general substrate transporter [Ramaria rubella]|nr:MFS general substrate transporter [Ramaria rubella]